MADLSSDIETNAQGPKAASGDSGSMTQHSLRDQIEIDIHQILNVIRARIEKTAKVLLQQ